MSEGESHTFYGKYRGTVVQNADPEFRGRIHVHRAGRVGTGPVRLV